MMDRRLKERLVGATILVALIVIIVPELLSGPKHPALPPLAAGLPTSPTRSVSVDLATNRATAEPEAGAASQAAPGETPKPPNPASSTPATSGANNTAGTAPPADTGEPAAASAPSVATLKAQNTAQAPLETAASSPKSPTATSHAAAATETSAASHHAWAVQLGSFASKENAERLMHRLQASGGSFYVAPGGSGSALRYRVRMGPLADRGSAERALAKLKAQGHAGTIVAPTS
jgi:DedD protein